MIQSISLSEYHVEIFEQGVGAMEISTDDKNHFFEKKVILHGVGRQEYEAIADLCLPILQRDGLWPEPALELRPKI